MVDRAVSTSPRLPCRRVYGIHPPLYITQPPSSKRCSTLHSNWSKENTLPPSRSPSAFSVGIGSYLLRYLQICWYAQPESQIPQFCHDYVCFRRPCPKPHQGAYDKTPVFSSIQSSSNKQKWSSRCFAPKRFPPPRYATLPLCSTTYAHYPSLLAHGPRSPPVPRVCLSSLQGFSSAAQVPASFFERRKRIRIRISRVLPVATVQTETSAATTATPHIWAAAAAARPDGRMQRRNETSKSIEFLSRQGDAGGTAGAAGVQQCSSVAGSDGEYMFFFMVNGCFFRLMIFHLDDGAWAFASN